MALAGAVVSKPDREEDDPAVRVLPGEAQRVEGRVDDAHVAAARLHLEQVVVRARHAQHVAEGAEDHVRPGGDGDRAVDHLERRDADRAAGAVHEAHRRRQQLVHAELQDGVGLAAADLHERPGPGDRLADAAHDRVDGGGVAVLVDVAHQARRPGALPAPRSVGGLDLVERADLREGGERLPGRLLVDAGDGEARRGRARSPRAATSGT